MGGSHSFSDSFGLTVMQGIHMLDTTWIRFDWVSISCTYREGYCLCESIDCLPIKYICIDNYVCMYKCM